MYSKTVSILTLLYRPCSPFERQALVLLCIYLKSYFLQTHTHIPTCVFLYRFMLFNSNVHILQTLLFLFHFMAYFGDNMNLDLKNRLVLYVLNRCVCSIADVCHLYLTRLFLMDLWVASDL